jgi:hypothetical protein
MISQINRFVSNGAGLEKTLRLIQSSAQVASVFTVNSTAVRLTTAKLQLALSKHSDPQFTTMSDLPLRKQETNILSTAFLPLLRLHRVLPARCGSTKQRCHGIDIRMAGHGQMDLFRFLFCSRRFDYCRLCTPFFSFVPFSSNKTSSTQWAFTPSPGKSASCAKQTHTGSMPFASPY